MKARFLTILAVFIGAGSIAQADLQINAGGIYAHGSEEDSLGIDLGVGLYQKHSTSALSSALTLNYLGISAINQESEDIDMEAGYDVVALDYRLFFPIAGDSLELFVEVLAGVANTDVTASIEDLELSADEWGFTLGFGGGVQWNVTQNFGFNLGYTYLILDEPSDGGVALGEDGLNLLRLNATLRF